MKFLAVLIQCHCISTGTGMYVLLYGDIRCVRLNEHQSQVMAADNDGLH